MLLNSENIIEICSENLPRFKKIIKGIKFEPKGIFNSEILLFVSLSKFFGVNIIIESGRANGQSTKIISEFFKNFRYKIYSIELDIFSPDVKTSFERLKNYKNLKLIFGDTFKEIHKLIIEECCILIDGPKSIKTVKLTIDLLKNSMVKAVFLHDIHKDSYLREDFEKIFTNFFFTDSEEYVEKFKSLDKKCWIDQRKHRKFKNWSPYRRGNKIMKSYSSTLLAIFNSDNSFNLKYYREFINKMKKKKVTSSIRNLLDGWPERLKKIIKFPIYYIYFEKIINKRKKLEIKDLFYKWTKNNYHIFKSVFFQFLHVIKSLK
jgi:hypothetical protein